MKYFKESRAFSFSQEGRHLAAEVTLDAFRRGLSQYPNLDERGNVRRALEWGLKARDYLAEQAKDRLNYLGGGNHQSRAWDLGYNPSQINQVKSIVHRHKTTPNLDGADTFLAESQKREELVGRLSHNILLAEKFPPEEIQKAVYDLPRRATVLRGLAASFISNSLNEESRADMLFITDSDLEGILNFSQKQKKGEMAELASQLAHHMIERQFCTEDDLPYLRGIFEAYTGQIMEIVQNWRKTSEYSQQTSNLYGYWLKKYQVLAGLPIIPIMLGEHFLLNREEVGDIRRRDVAHLWMNAENIDGSHYIPQLTEIVKALQIMALSHKSLKDPDVAKLTKAFLAWSEYLTIATSQNLSRLEFIRSKIKSETVIRGDIKDLGLIERNRELNAEIHRLRVMTNAYRKIMEDIRYPLKQETRGDEEGRVGEELADQLDWVRRIILDSEIQFRMGQVHDSDSSLAEVNWIHAVLPRKNFRSLTSYQENYNYVRLELSQIEKWLGELENKRNTLPWELEQKKEPVFKFLTYWQEKIKNSGERAWKGYELTLIDRTLAYLSGDKSEKAEIKEWFVSNLKFRQRVLYRRFNILLQTDHIRNIQENIRDYISRGHLDPKLWHDLRDSLDWREGPAFEFEKFSSNRLYLKDESQMPIEITLTDYLLAKQLIKQYYRTKPHYSLSLSGIRDMPELIEAEKLKQDIPARRQLLDLLSWLTQSPLMQYLDPFRGTLFQSVKQLDDFFDDIEAQLNYPEMQSILPEKEKEREGVRQRYNSAVKKAKLGSLESEAQMLEERISQARGKLVGVMLKLEYAVEST